MFSIVDYDIRYKPYDKSGGELKQAIWVKVPANPKGDGLQTLLEYKRGLEVFGVFILLLEKTTREKPENRGKLLNFREQPATVEEISKGISLKNRHKLVEYALSVLVELNWVKYECEDGGDGQQSKPEVSGSKFRPLAEVSSSKSSVEKSSVEKSNKRKFIPPTLSEVQAHIKENNYDVDAAEFVRYYTLADWHDKYGDPVRNWKQKMFIVWAKKKPKLKPKKCIHCNKIGVYTDKDDTGQTYWLCENHKPPQKPLPKNTPVPQMKKVPGAVNINDARNRKLDALGV